MCVFDQFFEGATASTVTDIPSGMRLKLKLNDILGPCKITGFYTF